MKVTVKTLQAAKYVVDIDATETVRTRPLTTRP